MDPAYTPSVEDVHEWDWENIWLLGTGKVGDVGVERNLLLESESSFKSNCLTNLLSSCGLGNSKRDTENGVRTKLSLV